MATYPWSFASLGTSSVIRIRSPFSTRWILDLSPGNQAFHRSSFNRIHRWNNPQRYRRSDMRNRLSSGLRHRTISPDKSTRKLRWCRYCQVVDEPLSTSICWLHRHALLFRPGQKQWLLLFRRHLNGSEQRLPGRTSNPLSRRDEQAGRPPPQLGCFPLAHGRQNRCFHGETMGISILPA